ncbi:hypothetical protein [uncultured Maribacter sp.]|uniref:hypothetical protein n=1 Tax=uncultured Maribacter sp. TaxID=431308 RepID=UPI0026384537|nr:hypothetical protein [uncultured Maribacter sp.]
MKTYNYVWVFFVLVIMGCTKSTNEEEQEKKINSVDADYTVLLKQENKVKAQLLNADYSSVSLNNENSTFSPILEPEIDYLEANIQTFYRRTSDCKGEIISYDFKEKLEKRIDVFTDLLDCSVQVNAVARHGSFFYVAYEEPITVTQKKYVLRRINSSGSEISFEEFQLTQKPLRMVFSNNRLFVLTIDTEVTNENNLLVFDDNTFEIISNQGMGYNVKNMFKKQGGDVVISYAELHSIVDVSSLSLKYVRYEDNKEPNFYEANQYNYDAVGNLYYNKSIDDDTISSIPVIYNMETNLATLYYYENFLREEQINVEYQIKETTVVAFDDRNGLMLIGYKKTGSNELGGLLRVKPAPDGAFIDNIDLNGVPYNIFVD